MSLELYSYSDFFPENMGAISDEHDIRFYQDISKIEKRYSGKWSPNTRVGILILATPR